MAGIVVRLVKKKMGGASDAPQRIFSSIILNYLQLRTFPVHVRRVSDDPRATLGAWPLNYLGAVRPRVVKFHPPQLPPLGSCITE